ncbi:hypothetical protein BJ508DRAFT_378801 [Ascobolus immersus RN42]|uniref:Uncharacterized protein n=1 Tax=Ascobolus immersus RN42 TaxID=1160509 RepID=A0A3N4I6Z2_ASCIM|nr:hypothetical protein BJ508DRAFT_378801 [Ascobolus immersus RN42]
MENSKLQFTKNSTDDNQFSTQNLYTGSQDYFIPAAAPLPAYGNEPSNSHTTLSYNNQFLPQNTMCGPELTSGLIWRNQTKQDNACDITQQPPHHSNIYSCPLGFNQPTQPYTYTAPLPYPYPTLNTDSRQLQATTIASLRLEPFNFEDPQDLPETAPVFPLSPSTPSIRTQAKHSDLPALEAQLNPRHQSQSPLELRLELAPAQEAHQHIDYKALLQKRKVKTCPIHGCNRSSVDMAFGRLDNLYVHLRSVHGVTVEKRGRRKRRMRSRGEVAHRK